MISPVMPVTGVISAWTPSGSRSCDGRQPLGDELAGAVDVGAPVELDVDDRQADRAAAADAADAGQAVQRRLDRERDVLLDLVGREPARLGRG